MLHKGRERKPSEHTIHMWEATAHKKCPHGAPPLHPAPSYASSHQVTEELSGYSQERQSHPRPLKGFLTTQKSLTVCEQPSTMCLLKRATAKTVKIRGPGVPNESWEMHNPHLDLNLPPFPHLRCQHPYSLLIASSCFLQQPSMLSAGAKIPSSKPH